MKYVIIVNNEIPKGLAANACAIIGMTMGQLNPEIIGHDIIDASGNTHPGISSYAVPVLAADNAEIIRIFTLIQNNFNTEVKSVPFTETAQTSGCYAEYEQKLTSKITEDIVFNGMGICGNMKTVKKLTAHLKLF